MISWYVPEASTFAADVDHLVLLVAVIVGVWFLLAELVFFALIFKFRARDGRRSQYLTGEQKHEKRWISYPHYAVLVFDVIIVIAALRVWNTIKIATPETQETVRVIAQQWAWTFVHAGPDGQLDTPDDITTIDDLNLQVDRPYQFELHSRDVLHSFSIPAFRLKQDAVPGRVIRGWFTPTRAGTYDVQCAEICGLGHGLMPARVHVQTAAQHAAWLAGAGSGAPGAAAAPAVVADAGVEAAQAAGGTR
jgi:cytochrome c oxidase subunit 2